MYETLTGEVAPTERQSCFVITKNTTEKKSASEGLDPGEGKRPAFDSVGQGEVPLVLNDSFRVHMRRVLLVSVLLTAASLWWYQRKGGKVAGRAPRLLGREYDYVHTISRMAVAGNFPEGSSVTTGWSLSGLNVVHMKNARLDSDNRIELLGGRSLVVLTGISKVKYGAGAFSVSTNGKGSAYKVVFRSSEPIHTCTPSSSVEYGVDEDEYGLAFYSSDTVALKTVGVCYDDQSRRSLDDAHSAYNFLEALEEGTNMFGRTIQACEGGLQSFYQMTVLSVQANVKELTMVSPLIGLAGQVAGMFQAPGSVGKLLTQLGVWGTTAAIQIVAWCVSIEGTTPERLREYRMSRGVQTFFWTAAGVTPTVMLIITLATETPIEAHVSDAPDRRQLQGDSVPYLSYHSFSTPKGQMLIVPMLEGERVKLVFNDPEHHWRTVYAIQEEL